MIARRNTQALSLLLLCSMVTVSANPASVAKEAQKAEKKIEGEIRKAEQKVAVVSDVHDKKATSPVISTFDQIVDMSQCDSGKEKQKVMEKRQTELAAQLEEQRKTLDDRLKQFNAKKDTMSKEAREKEEQELMTASNALQTDVRKAQEAIRSEMAEATAELAKLTDEAAVEIAKAENVDVLLEKNTGRVVYTKHGTDLTDKIQKKMNEKTALAKSKAPKAAVKTA